MKRVSNSRTCSPRTAAAIATRRRYRYLDEQGTPLFEVVRFTGKQFRQRLPDGTWGLNGVRRVLYRVPRLLEAVKRGEDVMVVEGERDADTLHKLGIAATTNPQGAGKWRDEFSESLRGAKVTIVADADAPGRAHALQVAESLRGVAATVNLVEPTRGKDISEHLASGGSIGSHAEVEIHSSLGDQPVTKESGLPFRPLREAIANAPPEPEWLWGGYLAPGVISLLAGRPKVGKSTLAFGLFAAITAGLPFLERETRRTGVLLLSEEREGTLAEKARRFNLNGSVDVLMRHELGGQPWAEVVEQAVAYCHARGHGLLAVDTWDKWTGLRGDDENKSGPVIEALQPLMKAAGAGLSVVLVTHQRKSAGVYGEAVRGSNALTGSVDVIAELERVSDVPHARVLQSVSRFGGTPEELALELSDAVYTARGDAGALRARLDTERVLDQLSETEEITAEELAEAAELPKGTVHKRLTELHGEGTVERTGEGKKGSPFRWKILSSRPHSLRDESISPDGGGA
jgi:5S rRNA maturation endonuclease (ribonuclease M5)/DNA-binding transcriptional ArsR family regulator